MSSKTDAKQRAALLKQMREDHADTVKRTQELMKEQRAIRKKIYAATQEEPKTVPEIAAITGLPTTEVLWHITAMKKYDLIHEIGMDGEYYQYQQIKES